MACRKILLVDDEEDIRDVARCSLEMIGRYEVLVAASGREGLALAEQERPDAIILDVMMPGFDGLATIAALKAQPSTADIPVVFLTAKTHPKEVAHYMAAGAHGVLHKPFDPLRLATQFATHLGWAAAEGA